MVGRRSSISGRLNQAASALPILARAVLVDLPRRTLADRSRRLDVISISCAGSALFRPGHLRSIFRTLQAGRNPPALRPGDADTAKYFSAIIRPQRSLAAEPANRDRVCLADILLATAQSAMAVVSRITI